jgi:hypothetical protein
MWVVCDAGIGVFGSGFEGVLQKIFSKLLVLILQSVFK